MKLLYGFALGSALVLGTPAALADDKPIDEAAVRAANDLMLEVSRAYTKVPALTDEMTMSFAAEGMGEQKAVSKIMLEGRSGKVTGVATMLDVTVVNDMLYAQMAGADGAVKTKLGTKPADATKKALGMMNVYMPPHFALRWAADAKGAADLFGFGFIEKPKIAGHQMIDGADGNRLHEVLITGSGKGEAKVRIDPKTKLIRNVHATGNMAQMGPAVITLKVGFKPKSVARLETPIAFDDKAFDEYFDTLDDMMSAGSGDINPSVKVGTAAPTFSLTDQDGKDHSLEAYAGKIVLLDWWGIW